MPGNPEACLNKGSSDLVTRVVNNVAVLIIVHTAATAPVKKQLIFREGGSISYF